MSITKETISGLKSLLEKNIDAVKGFKSAAKIAKNDTLSNFLQQKSEQRNLFAVQLSNIILKHGGNSNIQSTYKGAAHRIWMDISTAISSNNDEAVLDACETGERASVKEYDQFLDNHPMPAEIRNLLAGQRKLIGMTLRKIIQLENK